MECFEGDLVPVAALEKLLLNPSAMFLGLVKLMSSSIIVDETVTEESFK